MLARRCSMPVLMITGTFSLLLQSSSALSRHSIADATSLGTTIEWITCPQLRIFSHFFSVCVYVHMCVGGRMYICVCVRECVCKCSPSSAYSPARFFLVLSIHRLLHLQPLFGQETRVVCITGHR